MEKHHPNSEIVTPITPDGRCGTEKLNPHMLAYETVSENGEYLTRRLIANPTGLTCHICGDGWYPHKGAEHMADQCSHGNEPAHYSCMESIIRMDEKNLFTGALNSALIVFKDFATIPNGYGGAWNTPWYRVTIPEFGVIEFGRRKKVYNIEVKIDEDKDWVEEKWLELLRDEETTKGSRDAKGFYIHAWTDEHVKEYFAIISMALGSQDRDYQLEKLSPRMSIRWARLQLGKESEVTLLLKAIESGKIEDISLQLPALTT